MKLRGSTVRFLVISATVPNIMDVADWVGNRANNGPALVKEFGEEYRPCKLSRFVYSVPRRRDANDFIFAKALDFKLYGVLQQHCNNKPVLVFCPTRKGVMSAAELIHKEYEEAIAKKQTLPWSKPPHIEHSFSNKQLDKLAACGIGVHHAGIVREDRTATEQLYLKKALKVLFATSTLAVGVNLPAHTVIIKGVKLFQNGASQEYSDLDVMQMIGRAGRPQFDKEGVAIIMCEQDLEVKYKALAQGQTILESSLHLHLPEHLNSEIALGTIKDMVSAKEWLHNSFLFRRIQKNPLHYDIRKEGNKSWEQRMDDLVADSVKTLKDTDLVTHEGEDDRLSSTEYGDIMSKFYIRQATMVTILKLPDTASVREILEAISCADEFSDIKFRAGEKQVYNKLRIHQDIRYTLKKIEKPSDKVFILIQAILGAINLADPEYRTGESQPYTESLPILRHISRIARDQLPQYTIAISEEEVSVREDGVEVELLIECGLAQNTKVQKSKKPKKQRRWDMTMMLTLTSDNTFIDFRRISTVALRESRTFSVTAKLTKPSQAVIVYATSAWTQQASLSWIPVRRTHWCIILVPPHLIDADELEKARDLEGLEDIADFWDMSPDEDATPGGATRLSKDAALDQDGTPQFTSNRGVMSAPKQLQNGNYECNHTCKEKARCRHLCCREGLAKPPPMTKKRIEMLIAAADKSPRKQDGEGQDHTVAQPGIDAQDARSKPKPRMKEPHKPVAVDANRSLKKLEALHERMGVEKSLQLAEGIRIKLNTEYPSYSQQPFRKSKPEFDVEYSTLQNGSSVANSGVSVVLSDSDDDLPEPGGVFSSVPKITTGLKSSPDSTDYADPDFDALIAGLPVCEAGHTSNAVGRRATPTNTRFSMSNDDRLSSTTDWLPDTPSRKRKTEHDGSRPYKRQKNDVAASPSQDAVSLDRGSTLGEPLFEQALSDDMHSLFETRGSRSSASSVAPALVDDGDSFVLDTSLFDIMPSTPTWTERNRDEHSKADSQVALGHHASTETRFVKTHLNISRSPKPTDPEPEEVDDPLAELEAWLQSGAVEIGEE
ncbi:hypothetical protein BN946_scf185014.g46 [Trametes cinnabarina]|uniref:DNA 3'-5' helicase n=1 Tax=Pycnoporus cinnabarinus TaxID=5643 RepID=A0A060SH92_PYCCI|nr:hypothetical protein BN946_scf185014.g46 [Trametes cinnabarina]